MADKRIPSISGGTGKKAARGGFPVSV